MIDLALKAWTFLKSPWGERLLIGIAAALLIFGFAAYERNVQHAKDQIHERAAVAAVQASLNTCHANVSGLQTSIDRQNAATDALKADSDRRAQMLADGLADARKGRAGAEATARALGKPPVGIDACARAESARQAVLATLQ